MTKEEWLQLPPIPDKPQINIKYRGQEGKWPSGGEYRFFVMYR